MGLKIFWNYLFCLGKRLNLNFFISKILIKYYFFYKNMRLCVVIIRFFLYKMNDSRLFILRLVFIFWYVFIRYYIYIRYLFVFKKYLLFVFEISVVF